MMQSAEDRHAENTPKDLAGARYRRILVQGQVRARGLQHVAKMPFAEYDNMVNALPSDRADQPLCTSVLPRRAWRGRSISNAHRAKAPDEYPAIGPVAITDKERWNLLPATGLGKLTSNPRGSWMRGGAEPQKPAPVMAQDQQAVHKPERDRLHHE